MRSAPAGVATGCATLRRVSCATRGGTRVHDRRTPARNTDWWTRRAPPMRPCAYVHRGPHSCPGQSLHTWTSVMAHSGARTWRLGARREGTRSDRLARRTQHRQLPKDKLAWMELGPSLVGFGPIVGEFSVLSIEGGATNHGEPLLGRFCQSGIGSCVQDGCAELSFALTPRPPPPTKHEHCKTAPGCGGPGVACRGPPRCSMPAGAIFLHTHGLRPQSPDFFGGGPTKRYIAKVRDRGDPGVA